jgi:hypothetical protein
MYFKLNEFFNMKRKEFHLNFTVVQIFCPFINQSHGFEQLSLTRPGQQSKEDDNILFVGASTRPGNGVPLVLLGSKQVAKKAISKIKSYVPESV